MRYRDVNQQRTVRTLGQLHPWHEQPRPLHPVRSRMVRRRTK